MRRLLLFLALLAAVAATILAGCRPAFTPPAGEVEATEFQGQHLTPINNQRNNALNGTQVIDRETYRLVVDGLVDSPQSLSYQDLLNLPALSKLMPLNCVEGWSFTAKWTGPTLKSIIDKAKPKTGVTTVIFHTKDVADGYFSLDYQYIIDKNIIIGMKLNDVTIPTDRGFPFQVVAESKYGYKWSKWIDRIELSSDASFRGYWESYGYNNNADDKGPGFEGFP